MYVITQTKHSKPRRVFGLSDNVLTYTKSIEMQDVCYDKPDKISHSQLVFNSTRGLEN